jgi:ribosomal 50S subunit-associated protein YjgA (DUF615 family)
MSTAVYRDQDARQLEELIRRIRHEQARRTPQDARRVTAAALRRWKATGGTLRVFRPNEDRSA